MPVTESIKCLLIDRQFPQPEDHQIGTFKGGCLLGPRSDGEGKPEEQSWAVDTKCFWRQTRGQAKPLASGWPLEGGRGRAASQRWEHVLGVSWTPQASTWGGQSHPKAGTCTHLGGQEGPHVGAHHRLLCCMQGSRLVGVGGGGGAYRPWGLVRPAARFPGLGAQMGALGDTAFSMQSLDSVCTRPPSYLGAVPAWGPQLVRELGWRGALSCS